MAMLMPMLFADNAVLTANQGQIANYNITLNKTNSDIGINTFALLNNNNISIESVYQNCTATNAISCQASFIIQQGSWDKIAVFDNGNVYEYIPLQNPLNYTPTHVLSQTYITTGVSYLPYAVAIIISVIIIGNIAYYYVKKQEIE